MDPDLYEHGKNHAVRDLMRRSAYGNMPSDDEFAAAAGDDLEKTRMLKAAAQALDEQRRRNDNMRGRVDAQRDADRYAWAYIALHDPPKRVEHHSAEEDAQLGTVAERIAARRHLYRGLAR